MPTNTAGTTARQNPTQQVGYLRKTVVFGDNGTAVSLGTIPSGATILKSASGVSVDTVFNAATTNTLNVGTAADDNLYGTLLSLLATTFVPLDEAVSYKLAADTEITATVVLTGAAATTGSAEVVICYIPDNG